MQVKPLSLEGLMLIELKPFNDNRGFFVDRFHEKKFSDHGLPIHFVQDNHSRSNPGVLRGLHFQYSPGQGKLVGVVRGSIWDVAVDIRPGSPTFGRHLGTELSDSNCRLLWIPAGFAHGFCVLGEETADVFYKCDQLYDPKIESGINWSDPDLKIQWPLKSPIVSGRDSKLPSFAEYRNKPFY